MSTLNTYNLKSPDSANTNLALDASGNVAIQAGSASAPSVYVTGDANTGLYSPGADQVALTTGGTARLYIDSSGRVGVGSTSLSDAKLEVRDAGDVYLKVVKTGINSTYLGSESSIGVLASDGPLVFRVGTAPSATERARIDSSGRLLVGTSTSATTGDAQYAKVQIRGNTFSANEWGTLALMRDDAATTGYSAGTLIGGITFADSTGARFASFQAAADGATGSNDYPGRLVFSTTADGASSPTERMRISQNGGVRINCTGDQIISGETVSIAGLTTLNRSGGNALVINRATDDGNLVVFYQEGTAEGTISVSGTTVSYNGAHLSRWSQLPSGAERTEILRGSVLSNIDEMCEWTDEENEQLNRMKVSNVEGDKNVSGVFQAWDDDDDTYTNDFYCAMTGDFIIRIGAGVTVERGDLLMSAGDGTAKPQDDDIIRSKTIAKVTSTNVSCTYDDGSYCVPCVLMAC